MKPRVAALLLGLLLLATTPVAAQDLPDPGGLVPPGDEPEDPGGTEPDPDGGASPDGSTATIPDGGQFVGTASATSLELTLAGQGLTVGFTDARVQSGPSADGCADDQVACSEAAGELLLGEVAEAFAPGNEGPNDATAFQLPAELEQLLVLDIGTAVAEASTVPSAGADAAAATTELTLTETLAEQVDVQGPLQEISDSLVGPVADGDPSGQIGERLKQSLDFVIENLDQAPLATLAVGPSSSDSESVDGVTSASALSQGAELILVPTGDQELVDLGFPGLVIVEVSRAEVSVSTDATTGQATADPSIVRLSVLDPTELSYDVLEVAPGQSACAAEGTPLQICVSAADSEIVQDGPNAAAAADGVRIEALADPLPQLVLGLAAAEAGVSAAAAPPQAPPPPAEPAAPLPTTGFTLLLPGLALVGAGGASFALVRRRRI